MIEALLLGIVQGVTEFLPVSSSGHLLIFHELLGMDEGGLAFDVALHVGTLLAVVLFFKTDLLLIVKGFIKKQPTETRMMQLLLLATLPAVFFGLLFQDVIATVLRSPWVVVAMLTTFGILMIAAEQQAKTYKKQNKAKSMTNQQTLVIGFLQACALIPGVSRSGATISGGLLLGLDRVSATRFSFLLSVPIIFGAAVKIILSDGVLADVSAHGAQFAIGTMTAFISGIIAINFLLKFVAKYSIRTFAYYRFVVAGFIAIVLVVGR